MPKFIKFQEKKNGDIRGCGYAKASINREVNQ